MNICDDAFMDDVTRGQGGLYFELAFVFPGFSRIPYENTEEYL